MLSEMTNNAFILIKVKLVTNCYFKPFTCTDLIKIITPVALSRNLFHKSLCLTVIISYLII